MSYPTRMREYADQLSRIATSLAIANNEVVYGDITSSQPLDRVGLFTEGNLDKRTDKLNDQMELFDDNFVELTDLIARYIREVPLAAYDTGNSDADRFVRWLPTVVDLTPEQRDLTLVVRSRFAVEEIGRRNRLGHVRFQELVSLNDRLVSELASNPGLRIHLNPIRARAIFETGLLIGEDDLPKGGIEVLFYAFQTEVRTVILEPEGRALVQTLSDIVGPSSLARLKKQLDLTIPLDDESLMEMLTDCSELGLIAFS
ncbi:MAG: hypothetical protein HQ518_16725 [Rhodopirellula sp.]|nr:hypothetical protein [Rhodopirellula sp.]